MTTIPTKQNMSLVPPKGCLCASFFTVRGKHKEDCPAREPVNYADSRTKEEREAEAKIQSTTTASYDQGGSSVRVETGVPLKNDFEV